VGQSLKFVKIGVDIPLNEWYSITIETNKQPHTHKGEKTMMNNKKYSVFLANKDCIFDSESGFDSLAEVKKWVEQHSGHFRVMIDDEEGTFIKNHDPRGNFDHCKNNTYCYYDGWDWVYFNPFK